ncbi:MAG TPA: GTP cyclohydrolase I FolE [Anaerolineaceae bacterium]|nr:GTP cyclohydrolase I FolE [Anaerolineaceae bacterium]
MVKNKKLRELAQILDSKKVDRHRIEPAVEQILTAIGEDASREGLERTPQRVARMFEELTQGYREDPQALLNNAIFSIEQDDLVVVRDIEFYSLCEHHLLPFLGSVHVAYIPDGKIIGLSKIPRIVDMFARRLQVQERFTRQVAEFIDQVLHPKGIAVVVEAKHLCSMMRGVRKQEARMTTTCMLGEFDQNRDLRNDFLAMISR